jgi:hypothetical protein
MEQIRTLVSAGVVKIVQATCPIEEIREGQPIPEVYFLTLRCPKCNREFQLNGDLYSGWGHWK